MQIHKISLIAALFLLTNSSHEDNETLLFKDIVERYYNLKKLAILPEKGERSYMISSYDRKSEYDFEQKKYINWSANRDGDGYVKKEGDQYVLAHIVGTGVISRIWSAKPETGMITFEIDGRDVLSMPADQIFDGQHAPFNFPDFVYTSAKGKNNYIPICFQNECKIKASKDWGQFYQINYTLFPEGYTIPAFKGTFDEEEQQLLSQTASLFLQAKNQSPYKVSNQEIINKEILIEPQSSDTLYSIEGNKAIFRFELDVLKNDYLDDLQRNVEIEIFWDGSNEAAVSCPIGSFFGSSIHGWNELNQFSSIPLGMAGRQMYSNWYMPFRKKAIIILTNKADRKITLSSSVGVEAGISSDEFGYFHVKWNRSLHEIEQERWPDRQLLALEGKGRFCGMMLTVLNPLSGIEYGYDMPKTFSHWWWGEGDEKFYVDGEKFPSTFGTGTEDYFGYAWGWPERFSRPFHNQTYTTDQGLSQENAPNYVKNGNRVVSMNRFQIADNVPFNDSFFATIEQYYPDKRPIWYQTALYYYLKK
ncbi:DUF2961 domain-containing protein [Fulvivirgaceae bacterium BMA10]|uniref:DUF2961 domain-containing protein n=1 Tax=Splendidivirga corallicola TaxID=3051826 RepID=A0ABT8KVM6_9BACT|nr:DUF2961 domain-containing protein [Fulvivirgaceae bacterium BMA10]